MSLSSFVRRAGTSWRALQEHGGGSFPGSWSIVVGNEAADSDSICSALVFAYAKSLRSEGETSVLPVISC